MAGKKYLGPQGLSELVTLFKNDLTKKQGILQYVELPDPEKSTGRVVQYVGRTTDDFKKGLFYYSTGLEWEEVVGVSFATVKKLPDWEDADRRTIYFVLQDDGLTVKLYIKGEKRGEFYEAGAENYNTLLNTPLINGMSTVNDKDPSKPKEVELLVGVQQYPESDSYKPDALYPTSPEPVRVNELSMKALTDDEVTRVYEEAMK